MAKLTGGSISQNEHFLDQIISESWSRFSSLTANYCPNSGWVGDKWACNAKRIIQWEASHGPAPTR